MQFLEYLSIIRRRWLYVALGVVAGALAGLVIAPAERDPAEAYAGFHTLLVNSNSGLASSLNLEQTALRVESGAVPQRVAQRLVEGGLQPPRRITAVADKELRSLTITAIAASPESAAAAANIAADELNAELTGAVQTEQQQLVAAAQTRVADLQSRVGEVDQQLAGLSEDDPARASAESERDALAASLRNAQHELDDLQLAAPATAPLRTLEAASGRRAFVKGWRLPESPPVRMGMLAAFGLMLGAAGALAADRLDTRIRNKEDAERAFEMPVIAEIPPIPAGTRGRELLVATRPAAPFVEAYRALRTVVLFAAEEAAPGTNGSSNGHPTPPTPPTTSLAKVVLITSPAAGEGKTTTVGHLAAVLAEFGKRVLVISADFRRPRIHELFNVPREPGLSDVLESGLGGIRLSDLQMATSYPGVHLLPSGGPVDNPARLLTETRQLIAAARSLFDYVLIDTPPLLVANDATELAAVADMVLLMAKADRSSRDSARRSTEILRRVDAPLLGVVVAAAHDTPTAYGYYRYRYYAEADQGVGRRRRFGRKSKAKSTPEGTAKGAPVGAMSGPTED